MDIVEIQERLEELKAKKARLEGKLAQQLEELRKKFGVEDIEEAKKKLEALRKHYAKLKRELDQKLEEFKDKYGALLDED